MDIGTYAAASLGIVQLRKLEIQNNNLANVNTTGFKRQRTEFQDLFYDIVAAPGTKAGDQGTKPAGTRIRRRGCGLCRDDEGRTC
jgi:flagellar basal-body rod protein FlgG